MDSYLVDESNKGNTMKKLLTVLVAFVLLSVIYASNKNNDNGNGQLTQEVAQKWSEKKCGSEAQVELVEKEGYKVTCTQPFQGVSGQYNEIVMLGFSDNPDKPFTIYAFNN